jgi:hypothetical protein
LNVVEAFQSIKIKIDDGWSPELKIVYAGELPLEFRLEALPLWDASSIEVLHSNSVSSNVSLGHSDRA